jgi:hypothetical protein
MLGAWYEWGKYDEKHMLRKRLFWKTSWKITLGRPKRRWEN